MTHMFVDCDCGETMRLATENAGREGACKKCGAMITVPNAGLIEQHAGRHVSLGDVATLGENSDATEAESETTSSSERTGKQRKQRSQRVFEIVLDAMCCVMVADRKVTGDERRWVRKLMTKLKSPWDDQEVDRRVSQFIERVKSADIETVLDETCRQLHVVKDSGQQRTVLKCLDSIAKADGHLDEREQSVRDRIQTALRESGSDSVSSIPAERATGLWQPGQLVDGRYQVEQKLGQGGCGIVWKARHTEWNIDLAVKEFIDDANLKPDKRERRRTNFVRESQAWVDDIGMHPHIVTAWYVRELQGTPYLFLEYCEGGDLGDWIDQGKTRDLKTALDIAIQLAWGLAHCHEKGIVHRDFKPQNVMMTAAGTAKITDFGMVKFAAIDSDDDAAADETGSGDIRQTLAGRGPLGTPPYMPPEQWGTGQIDHRADLYALGVTIYELLIGEYPIAVPARSKFPNQRVWLDACEESHREDQPSSLLDQRDDVPAELEQLVQTCLAKQADDRPTDASSVVQTLLQIYESETGEPHGRPTPSEIQPLADGWNNQGVSLFDLGKQKEARQRFEAAIESDPHHPEANYNLGLIRWRNAEITDARLVQNLREVCASHADQWIDEFLLAQVHVERADHESALKLLESIEEHSEDAPEIGRLLATLRGAYLAEQWGECLRTFEGHTNEINSVFFSADGRYALSGSVDKTLKLWDVKSGECLRTFEGHTEGVESVSFSADGRYALSGSHDKTLKLWNVKSGKCLRTFEGHTNEINSVSFSADGSYALSGSWDKTLKLWDVKSGECLRTFEGHTREITSVSFSSDGRYAWSGSLDDTLKLWDVKSGECLRTFETHTSWSKSVSFSADGRYALSGSFEGTLKLWDVKSGECLRTFEGHTRCVESVSFSADGRYALSGSHNNTLELWDVGSGQCLRTFEGQKNVWGRINSVSFSSDGRYALSGSHNNTLKLWQIGRPGIRKAKLHLTQVLDSQSLLQSQTDVENRLRHAELAVSDGEFAQAAAHLHHARSTASSARKPKLLKLWSDLYTQLPRTGFRGSWYLRTFEGHTDQIHSVSFSADGRYALSGSDDHTVRLWFLDWELGDNESANWDDGALPYLQNFLTLHTPPLAELPQDRKPTEEEIRLALTLEGKPEWSEANFEQLLHTLGCAGFGWLRPEGVKKKLLEMAADWTGPPLF